MKEFVFVACCMSCCPLVAGQPIDNSTPPVLILPDLPVSNLPVSKPVQVLPKDDLKDKDDLNWLEQRRKHTKAWLGRTAYKMDDWFGTPNPAKPATASLRVMLDVYDNKYDGTSFKPKLRGRLKLPTLEDRLSVIIGDDTLEHYDQIGWHINPDGTQKRFDTKKVKDDNSSLALRFSKWRAKNGIETDADIGTRSGGEIYGQMRAKKSWQDDDIDSHFEQIYRYGTKSEHFLRTNYVMTQKRAENRSLTNHSYIEYTNDGQENLSIGNTLYQTHLYPDKLGEKRLSYGLNVYARVDESTYPNSYGAFVNYRQPIWRPWLFVQGELTYYNHRLDDKDHHLASFVRLEMQF